MMARRSLWFAAFILAALAVRLAGIQWSLPNTLNADEPHVVNLAVSFGDGSLRPYAMKYPTLWPYILFAAYGVYFLVWSALGLRHGLAEFVGLYAWHPGGFFLIGRLLAAAFSVGGLWILWRADRDEGKEPGVAWAPLLLAFSPVLVELAHSAKPDCAMFFFACAAWHFALKVQRQGQRRDHWLAGAAVGLALACQYTAFPVAAALPLAHGACRPRAPRRWLLEGVAAAVAALFVASPFIFLDFPLFLAGLKDMQDMRAMRSWSAAAMLPAVLSNVMSFAGPWSIAGIAAVAGAARLWARDRGRALVLAGPVLLYVAFLSANAEGAWARYMLGAFPSLALLAGEGLRWAGRARGPAIATALAVLALGPGLARCVRLDLEMRRPDTRAEAKAWIESHVPQGAAVLLDLPHASPDLRMTKAQALELAERTRAAGSPRSRLYRGMADFHPGGGYRIYRVKRRASELASGPKHVEASQADAPTLDVSGGLAAARAAGVEYVVASSFGATPQRLPELGRFFDELRRQGRLLKTVDASQGPRIGPDLQIFEIKAP